KFCAILAGIVLTGITLMTCASLIGRNADIPALNIVGDFELTGVAAGAAIALFLPWCQVGRSSIIVDFFTAKATERPNARLVRFGALLRGWAWRWSACGSTIGGLNAWHPRAGTVRLGFPEGIDCGPTVPPLVLTAVIGRWQGLLAFGPEVNE